MAEIVLEGVTKLFADGTEAVHDLDVEIPEDLTGGTIAIGDRIVTDVPPGDRDVAMVFQNYQR